MVTWIGVDFVIVLQLDNRYGFSGLTFLKKMTFLKCILQFLLIGVVTGSCHICGKRGNSALTHPYGFIHNTTCASATVKYFRLRLSAADCRRLQRKFRHCCDGTRLPPKPQTQKPPPTVLYKGPNPVCDLCISGGYPENPTNIIHLLYVGRGTCKRYYIYGREGGVPQFLCDTLRYYAQEPCGCPVGL